MKKTKKRYAHCPKCGQYTRCQQKDPSSAWLFVSSLLYFLQASKYERPPCSNCGHDTEDSTDVFLETEINDNKKEIAYYTPEGKRIEIKQQIPLKRKGFLDF